jgi:uncharacterized membrane protein/uncharacterized membrane protein YeaQ/YmgE (transglycosylase-associated protein family)
MHTVVWILSAFAAGAVARMTMKGRNRGFLGDVALGLLGSVSGAWILRFLRGEVPPGNAANLGVAFTGAILLVAVGRLALTVAKQTGRLASEVVQGNVLPDLETQIRRLSSMERHVLARVLGRDQLPRAADEAFKDQLTLGERVADRVARFGGSWTFLGVFGAFMLGWMFLNTQAQRPMDPYPFILLNLVLSCLAAIQAPVIMMSQNRQATKDRFEAQLDYQVNLRAEMQIGALHLKLDEARASGWQEIVEMQRRQLEVLERIEHSLGNRGIDTAPAAE